MGWFDEKRGKEICLCFRLIDICGYTEVVGRSVRALCFWLFFLSVLLG